MANTLKFGNGEWYGKKDTILAYNDENYNFKPLPFSFDRASSATVINKDGLIETVGSGEPRIDFQGNTKGALLLEPSRTNLITQSESFDNAYWTKSGSSVTSGFTSPNGTASAFKLVEDTSTGSHLIYRATGIAIATGAKTVKIYAKYSGRQFVSFRIQATGGTAKNYRQSFDILNGVIGTYSENSPTYSISALADGWYEISMSLPTTDNNTIAKVYPYLMSTDNTGGLSYTGDGTSGVYIYGAQLEQGSYATSYIPTQGGVVTRVAETCSQTVPSGVIGQTEGTLFFECDKQAALNNARYFGLSDGTSNNRVDIYHFSTNNIGIYVATSVNEQVNASVTIPSSGNFKFALGYANNDYVCYVNGVQVGTYTNASVPLTSIALLGTNSALLPRAENNRFNQAQLYNTRLSNSELQALTTI